MGISRRAARYVGASDCTSIRSARALDTEVPVFALVPGHPFDGPFTVATVPVKLLPALVAQDDLEFDGTIFRCGMQPGVADFREWNIRGYVWPYMRFGQSDGEPSTLWFMLTGYTGSFEKAEYMDDFLRGHQAATWRLVRDDLDEGSQLIHKERGPAMASTPAYRGAPTRLERRCSKRTGNSTPAIFALAGHTWTRTTSKS